MSWCLMQKKVTELEQHIDVMYRRTGGRGSDFEPEPCVNMNDVQVMSMASKVKFKVKVNKVKSDVGQN